MNKQLRIFFDAISQFILLQDVHGGEFGEPLALKDLADISAEATLRSGCGALHENHHIVLLDYFIKKSFRIVSE